MLGAPFSSVQESRLEIVLEIVASETGAVEIVTLKILTLEIVAMEVILWRGRIRVDAVTVVFEGDQTTPVTLDPW